MVIQDSEKLILHRLRSLFFSQRYPRRSPTVELASLTEEIESLYDKLSIEAKEEIAFYIKIEKHPDGSFTNKWLMLPGGIMYAVRPPF